MERLAIRPYGNDFVRKLRDLFDLIAAGGSGHILIKNELDTICYMCPIRSESCLEPDTLNQWYGAGQVMKGMDLTEGGLYPFGEFMGKVKQLYHNRNPNRG